MVIEVILPISVKTLYMYRVAPECESSICVGARVAVELGVRKIYSAIVYAIHTEEIVTNRELKYVSVVLDSVPVVSEEQLKLWMWIADYYMCSPGEVMRRFFPVSMRMDTYLEMLDSGFNFQNKYNTKNVKFVTLSSDIVSSVETFNQFVESLKRAKSQTNAFIKICELLGVKEESEEIKFNMNGVSYSELTDSGVSSSVINLLVKREAICVENRDIKIDYSSVSSYGVTSKKLPILTAEQQISLSDIQSYFINKKETVLLFGVSGAGKTEVYAHLISESLARSENVLLMLPDLALSTQLVKRLESYFGDLMFVYNARQTPTQRHAIYNRLLNSTASGFLVVTTCGGVGLPFHTLGLVVVDEEHSETYKITYNSPRINGRDAATVLAKFHGAKTLLVSATPSVESFYNQSQGKYGLVTLSERFNRCDDPKITLVERRLIASKEKRIKGYGSDTRYFSTYLINRIGEIISQGEQVILFQNRRGYSSSVECGDCGDVALCPECNIPLTYHSYSRKMVCHYCSYACEAKGVCGKCGSSNLLLWGVGTQNVEHKIREVFPDASIVRVDSDTLKSGTNSSALISGIENGEYGIIIGTSVIAKGFDFKNVSLVGVVNCDSLLSFADFRASEHAYSLLTQLAGRTTRGENRGEIIIQSNRLKDSVVEDIYRGSYVDMYNREIEERSKFMYPPFSKLIELTLSHKDINILSEATLKCTEELKTVFGARVLGPTIPIHEKINGVYRRLVYLKLENGISLVKAKQALSNMLDKTSKITININVDA